MGKGPFAVGGVCMRRNEDGSSRLTFSPDVILHCRFYISTVVLLVRRKFVYINVILLCTGSV